jgi:thiol-disulfide isomerase/thioredoxin
MVEGNKVIVNQEGGIVPQGTLKLAPTQRQKVYDRTLPDGRLCRGIYHLDGDHLKICLGFPGAERPTDFTTKPGEQSSLMVYKRYEPRPAAVALGADRSAEQILKAIDCLMMPAFDLKRMEDRAYLPEYQAKYLGTTEKRAELILELYKAAPDHERVPALMVERWRRSPPRSPQAEAQIPEIDAVLAHSKDRSFKLEGTYIKARTLLFKDQSGGSPDLSSIEEFLKLAPKEDDRGTNLLYSAACLTRDEKKKAALEDRILREFPDSMVAAEVRQDRHQRELVGKPFDLEFIDAISGSEVSIKKLKGKVVVVDFWATWCGPCVAEIPRMKELYAKYRDQGLEFIGVSLDKPSEQGGLDSLKKFIREKEIAWPQYYQGNGWESEFSKYWGISGIPTVFVVDPDGRLYSVEGREKLETMITELLKKKTAAADVEPEARCGSGPVP